MKKILFSLILSIASLPAYADPLDINVGNPERYVKPPAVSFSIADTTPGCSIASGYLALYRLPANSPAAYCDIAIGNQVLSGKMTSAAINNIGLGYQSCKSVTTGSSNICLGSDGSIIGGPGSSLTTGLGNIHIGAGAGSSYSTSNNNIVFEGEGVASGNAGSNNVLFDGHGGWIGSNSVLLSLDGGYQAQFSGQYVTLIGLNAGRLNVNNGGAENNIIVIGGDQNSGVNTHDVATSISNNVISVGGGTVGGTNGNHPGTFDTAYGLNALHTNAQDSAKQAAFGFSSLATSNVAAAQNTAFGYQSGKTVTTGKNNVFFGYNAGSSTLTTGSSNIIIGSGVTALAAGTSSELNIGGLVFGQLAGSANPTLSACGTSPAIDVHSNNASGTVTAGSGALASCTITFASPYVTWNHCKVTSHTGGLAGFAYTYSKTIITITGTSITSDLFDYVCDGN